MLAITTVPNSLEHKLKIRYMANEISDLSEAIGAVVLVYRHVIEIGQTKTGFSEAIRYRLRRKACPMFYTAESLLFSGSQQYAITDQSCRCVAMKSVEA
jgi:hypothetical protein